MNSYDVIIIGSGIGGLTCGAFLAKHGKRVLIVEQHFKPGGCVTSFSRQGFTFDVPSVVGSMSKEFGYGRILSELGIFDRLEFIKLDKLFHFIFPDLTVECFAKADRYQAELESLFPDEKRGLCRYFSLMRSLMRELQDSSYAPGWLQYLRYPFRYPRLVCYAGKCLQDILDRFFKDARLKIILGGGWQYLGIPPSRLSAAYMLFMYQSYIGEGTYAPRGGFQKMADVFADVFREMGGELRFQSAVNRITIRGGRASGIVLDSGEEIAGKAIVSNADMKKTFLELVGREQLTGKLIKRVDSTEMSASGVVVSLGVRMTAPETFNCGTVIYHPSWDAVNADWEAFVTHDVVTDFRKQTFGLEVRSLADRALAPSGCHTVKIIDFPVSYQYQNQWMRNNRGAYLKLKEQMGEHLIAAAEQVLPGLSRHVLVSDVSAPLTYERYLRATDGAWYDAACIPEQVGLSRMPSRTPIPGLYLTGAKSFPGHGIVAAMQSGAFTADILLEKRLLGGRYSFRD